MRLTIFTLAVLCAGCHRANAPTDANDDAGEITLFKFAGVRWVTRATDPAECTNSDKQRLERAKLLFQAGQFEETVECVRPLLWTKKHRADACFMHGIARARQACYSCANYYVAEAIESDPQNPFYRVGYAWLLCQQNKFKDAEREAKRATELTTAASYWQALHEVRRLARQHQREVEKRKTIRRALLGVVLVLLAGVAVLVVVLRLRRTVKVPLSNC